MKNMKLKFILFFVTCLLILLPLKAQAEGNTPADIADKAGAYDIESPYLTRDEIEGRTSVNIFGKAAEIIKDSFKDGCGALAGFGKIMAVVTLCCVMQAMKAGKGEELDLACGYISALAVSAVAFGVVYRVFILVTASMESLTLVMSSLLPIMSSLFVMGGSPAAGAASAASLTLVLTIISLLCTKLLMPLLRTSFALCLVGALPSGRDMSAVTNFIKSLASTLLVFLFTLMGTALYFQTSIAAAGDNYFSRSVRFASGIFIPIIGNMLGDAVRTVMASVSLVKATVGAAGLVMILSVIIPPLITVVLNKLMLSLSSALAKAMGCEKEGALLFDLCGILNILLALVAGAGCVCIIALALFIKTGVT